MAIDPPNAAELMFRELYRRSHRLAPDRLEELLDTLIAEIGASDAHVYLVDYQQSWLIRLAPGHDERLDVETSMAGRAFSTGEITNTSLEGTGVVWAPLIDGAERVGVMRVTVDRADEETVARIAHLAAAVTHLVVSESKYTDAYAATARVERMTLAAEMQWSLLPPLTFTTEQVAVAGILEPAYSIGGDAFDYAYNHGAVDIAILDGIGHGLEACLPTSLVMASLRHSRRSGLDLEELYHAADQVLREQFADVRFATAQIGRLDLATGVLRWLNAGHPPPILVRQGVIGPMPCRPSMPLGLGGKVEEIVEQRLQPGDRVLFYTDGVVEGQPAGGEPFGEERLMDLLDKEVLSDRIPAETVRRVAHAVLDHHAHDLRDDFTMVLVRYYGPAPAIVPGSPEHGLTRDGPEPE